MSSDPISLSHLGPNGEANMVDVGHKPSTQRSAKASGIVQLNSVLLDQLLNGALPKGDALATARIAGISAAKQTHEWIPLCHPLSLDWIKIEFERISPQELRIHCTAKATARTGVEMEALTGVCAAALTIYDMAKSADKGIVLGPFQLETKTGGKSGDYYRTRTD